MLNIKALLQRRADIQTAVDTLFAESQADLLSDDDRAKLDGLESELDGVKQGIAQLERHHERERNLSVTPAVPVVGPLVRSVHDNIEDDPRRGFVNIGDFAMAVYRLGASPSLPDPRLAALSRHAQPTGQMQESGAAEGFMVPPEMRREIFELIFELNDLLGMVDSEPTNSNAVDLLADESTPWGTTGIQVRWRAEASQMTTSKLETLTRTVKLEELYAFVLATEELLADAPRLNDRLTRKTADAFSWKIGETIFQGTGAGVPLGFMQSAALVSVAKESGQAADTVNATNLLKMFSRLLQSGVARSVWFANSDVLPQIGVMSIANQPVWIPQPAGMRAAPGGVLLGRPLIFTEHAKTIGDKGDIVIIDPKGYFAPRKQAGIEFAESMHLYFDYNIRAFRWIMRFGGQPHLSAPVTPPNSALTKSHFVTLDERT